MLDLKNLMTLFCMTLFFAPAFQAQAQNAIPDFSMTVRSDVPNEFKWKTSDIYPSQEAWQNDKEIVKGMISQISVKSKAWTSSAAKMLEFLTFNEELSKKFDKLAQYASLQATMDVGNTQLQAMAGEIRSLSVDYRTALSFFDSDVLRLGEKKFREYLGVEKKLEVYSFPIEKTFRSRDHILPNEQEELISRVSLFTGTPSKASNVLNNLELPSPEVKMSDGKDVALNIANYSNYRTAKNPEDRKRVMHTYWDAHKKFENTFACLMDGNIKQHYFYAQTYKYSNCLESSLFSDNIDQKVYHQLITSVRAKLPSLHRYLNIKKELLGLKMYSYDDIYASAVKSVDKKYTWQDAETIIKACLKPLGEEYGKGLERSFSEGWIDIYPNKGKEAGAYSSSVYGVHPYIKMNYNGDYNSVSTLAHELGHSMHSFFSEKTQPYATADYTTFLAEIASTFNENLLMQYLLKNETDEMFKLYILDNYLDQVRATIFRQTLFAEFELAMHERVENGQSLTADWLNKTYLDLTRTYYGHDLGVMEVDDYIQNEWSFIPHFYRNFYVFQYSTGLIASMALSEKVLNGGPAERDRYLDLLKSGGKDYPISLLKVAGVDMTTTGPTEAAFANFNRLLGEMETIINNLKKEGKI